MQGSERRGTWEERGLNDEYEKRKEWSSANKVKHRQPPAVAIDGGGSFERSHLEPDFSYELRLTEAESTLQTATPISVRTIQEPGQEL